MSTAIKAALKATLCALKSEVRAGKYEDRKPLVEAAIRAAEGVLGASRQG